MVSFEFSLCLSAILKLDFLKSPEKSGSGSPPRGIKLGNSLMCKTASNVLSEADQEIAVSNLFYFINFAKQ